MMGVMRHLPESFDAKDKFILDYVLENELSMTSELNLISTFLVLDFVIKYEIPGDFVECGTWRGGHGIIAAHMFEKHNQKNRNCILIDTFTGMTNSSSGDKFWDGQDAAAKLNQVVNQEKIEDYLVASEENLIKHLDSLNLKHFCEIKKGDVRQILKEEKFKPISFLRLDTDFYDSTKFELEVLFPKVTFNGFILIDDYDAWSGSKKATDEFWIENKLGLMLTKIDYGARLVQKTNH
jgi:hypothetical protein